MKLGGIKMDKNRKRWGYIFDEKLDMLIPNIPRQKKFVKIFLILSLIFFIIALMQLYFLDKNNEEKKKIFFKEFNKKTVYSILEKINKNKIEGYYNLPFFREEITLFTSDKIIHKKVKFSSRNETLLSESEKELYNYLLDLFKEEIPEEFFEIRNKK